jgi:hypothetical protein
MSSSGVQPKRMFSCTFWREYSHRATSEPTRSAASGNTITLPQERCIGRPCSSSSFSYTSTLS